jgi:glycosyltransferase involved in cell wall biosynthesis
MKTIVISGANLYSGGTLSIFQDCVRYLDSYLSKYYKVIVIVNDKSQFINSNSIEFIEIRNIRKSYLHRFYYEYFYYLKLSKLLKPYFWLSINDISPNIISNKRAVYCHNPSPFRKVSIKDLFFQKQLFFFTLFYKFLYRINIKKNNYVIVQQNWIRNAFSKMFSLDKAKIILFPPQIIDFSIIDSIVHHKKEINNFSTFFYPTLARPFKNIELICEAVKLLIYRGHTNFRVIITIDGTENNYSKSIVKRYSNLTQLDFTGFISREEVFNYYKVSDCLIFPSTLETWGLPITEFKLFHKPILLADLEYAHETLGNYDKGAFFKSFDPIELANKMKSIIQNDLIFDSNLNISHNEPIVSSWDHFFKLVLN